MTKHYLSKAQFDAEVFKCLNCKSKPCMNACPVNCCPQEFIGHIKNNDFEKANELWDFSYEILFSPIRFCNFSTELVFETNPFINNYSFSINLKEYLKDDFSGFFVGISPVSKINIGNLSANNGYLNYGLGFSFGFNKRINNKFHFETEGNITFCLYDKNNTMKVDLSTSIQYLLF